MLSEDFKGYSLLKTTEERRAFWDNVKLNDKLKYNSYINSLAKCNCGCGKTIKRKVIYRHRTRKQTRGVGFIDPSRKSKGPSKEFNRYDLKDYLFID